MAIPMKKRYAFTATYVYTILRVINLVNED